jgi:hypothetical protein
MSDTPEVEVGPEDNVQVSEASQQQREQGADEAPAAAEVVPDEPAPKKSSKASDK